MFAFHGFFQMNNILNSHNSLLDLVFTNNNFISVDVATEPAVPPDSYHPPLSLTFHFTLPPTPSSHSRSFYNFKKSDFFQITSFFTSYNWEQTFINYDADEAMTVFYDALHYAISLYVPFLNVHKSSFPPWFTPVLRKLVFEKNCAHAKYKSSLSLVDYRKYSSCRARYKYLSRTCYRSFIACTETSLVQNPRSFWNFVRKNRSSPTIPESVQFETKISHCIKDSAHLFSKFFSSVYSLPTVSNPITSLPSTSFDLPSHIQISVDDVHCALTRFRNNKSIGPDGIPADFLYNLRDVLSFPLHLLFQKSLIEGKFPSILKIGSITPILKTSDPANVSNYRPISVLCHIAILFETLVLNNIRPAVNHILINEQHGFRPGRSTTTCNLVLSSYIHEAFLNSSQVDVIYTDFAKAFDSVDHSILIAVLDSVGFSDPLLSWFRSYLVDRKQWVSIRGTSSPPFSPSSGVPQGAVLSPLLFSLFINSVNSVLHYSKILTFADDMKIYLRIDSTNDCTLLQSDLSRFVERQDGT
jgi:hypothetical protein